MYRDDAVLAAQPQPTVAAKQRAAGICPSVDVADFGLPTEHNVYCEVPCPPDGTHAGNHIGLAGVDVTGFSGGPVYWTWSNP